MSSLDIRCKEERVHSDVSECSAVYSFEYPGSAAIRFTIGDPFSSITVYDWNPLHDDAGESVSRADVVGIDVSNYPVLANAIDNVCDELTSMGVEYRRSSTRILVASRLAERIRGPRDLPASSWNVERLMMEVDLPSTALIRRDGELIIYCQTQNNCIAEKPTLAEAHLHQAIRNLDVKMDAQYAALRAYLEMGDGDDS